MALERFNDITGLVAVWNAGDLATVNKTGSNVDSVDPAEGTDTAQLLQKDILDDTIQHDGTTLIGQLPCFYDDGTDGTGGLKAILDSPITTNVAGLTIVAVSQRTSTTAGNNTYALTESSSSTSRFTELRNSGLLRFQCNGTNNDTAAIQADTPVVTIHSYNAVTDQGVAYVDNVSYPLLNITTNRSIQDIYFGVGTGTGKIRGRYSILAIYAHAVDATEASDLYDLCQTWITTGEGPATGPPQPTHPLNGYYRAAYDDPATTMQWLWKADAADPWVDAVGALSDAEVTLYAGNANGQLNINSVVEADAGFIMCRGSTTYEPQLDTIIVDLTVHNP